MKIRRFRTAEAWKAAFANIKDTYPLDVLPIKLTILRLWHDPAKETAHYCYILEIGKLLGPYEVWIFDEATDFSGTGGRFKESMDRWINRLKREAEERGWNLTIQMYELPYEIYNILSIIHYHEYMGG